MMKIILATLLAISFISCSTSNIQYDDKNSLTITTDSQIIVKSRVKKVYENRVNLSNINIYQDVLILDNSTILIYENIRISSGYKFSYGINRIIGIVFSDYTYDLLSSKGNLQFYKLSNNKETLYLIAQNLNKKGLKILYSLDKSMFKKVQQTLVNSTTLIETQSKAKSFSSDSNASQCIKSNWSIKNIILDNIIQKVGSHYVPQ